TSDFQCVSLGHFVIWYSNLLSADASLRAEFRISIFGFRLNITFRSGTIKGINKIIVRFVCGFFMIEVKRWEPERI
ncbi:MAG: hypothetical protein KAU60_08450, partial [Desulfobacterales bacterium]|nr:hypothetical protein [Desulfobacterales bacterium]